MMDTADRRLLYSYESGQLIRELSDDEVEGLHRNARIYEEHRELHRSATVVD